jgi:uncharacterized protein
MASTARPDGKRGLRMLQSSSLDGMSASAHGADTAEDLERWVPSRFNVRARDERGHLVLWNTLSNSISAFDPEQAEGIVPMLSRYGFDAPRQGMVEYLVKRGFLVRSGTDEYRHFQLAFRSQHHRADRLELIILAAEPGQRRREHRDQDTAGGAMRPEVRQGVRRMLAQRVAKLQSLDVSWLGADQPSGWAVIEELAPFVAALAEEHGVAYTARVNIGAPLLTPAVVDRLLAWQIPLFQVMPESIPESDDGDRQELCAIILRNFTSMSQRADQFRVLVHLDHERNGGDDLEPCLARMKAVLGQDPRFELRFHAARRRGGPEHAAGAPMLCGVDEQHALVAQLEAAARAHGLRFGMLKHVSRVGGQVCHAARPHSFVIGPGGKLMKCTVALDSAEHNVVGRLTATGDMEIDADRMARWTEPAFEHDALCQRCVVLPNCQGLSCPLVRIETGERHCAPTRATGKRKLRELFQLGQEQARRKTIDTAIPDTGTN